MRALHLMFRQGMLHLKAAHPMELADPKEAGSETPSVTSAALR